jgi:GAT domain
MLIRILADNPGPTFTRNIDSKFVSTTKELLRQGRDPSVQQILRETLQALYTEKAYDTNLQALFQMWGKEQGVPNKSAPNGAWQQHQALQQQTFAGPRNRGGPAHGVLPAPAELAARIEEARTSAKLLQQLVQSTAPHELQTNDLVREFSERCQAAQRSMQQYINCDNPPPDDDTMQTLIETSEQLSLAASKHSRAVLQARRATTQQMTPPPEGNTNGTMPPPVASATFVPVGQPPGPAVAPPTNAPYIPPPVPPPTMRANLERRSSQDYTAPTTPPRPTRAAAPAAHKPLPHVIPSEPIELPTPNYDNPFSDKHENVPEDDEDHDDLYNTSPTAPSRAPPVPTGYGTSASPAESYSPVPRQSPTRPAPQAQDSWRRPVRGPEGSYAPGFSSTPSYIRRQESSGDNLTMHGGGIAEEPEDSDAVSPDLERREKVGRGVGTVVGGSEVSAPTASEVNGRSGSDGNVSPIDTRSSLGYRYYGRQ